MTKRNMGIGQNFEILSPNYDIKLRLLMVKL